MKVLVDYVYSKGFKFGIYLDVGWVGYVVDYFLFLKVCLLILLFRLLIVCVVVYYG